MHSRSTLLVLCCALGASLGCAHGNDQYLWVDALPPTPDLEPGYHIQPGDTISAQVYNQDRMSTKAKVRDDGKISVPFLNDVVVAGRTPPDVAKELEQRLKGFIVNPVVTVTVDEMKPLAVSVLGEVAHPGVYPLEPGAGPLQALASAGGMTEYANKDRIFVLRQSAPAPRIRFKYQALIRPEGRSATFKLQRGDVVVVE